MKQLLCIIGNIGSGKTTLARELLTLLPHFSYHAIDDYRRKYNPNATQEGEQAAYEHLCYDIWQQENAILEMSGVSDKYRNLKWEAQHKGYRVFVVKLLCQAEYLYDRLQQRHEQGYELPPMPYTLNLSQSVRYIEHVLDTEPHTWVFETERQKSKEIAQEIVEKMAEVRQNGS
jgi:adenylate kinase family enzyme